MSRTTSRKTFILLEYIVDRYKKESMQKGKINFFGCNTTRLLYTKCNSDGHSNFK